MKYTYLGCTECKADIVLLFSQIMDLARRWAQMRRIMVLGPWVWGGVEMCECVQVCMVGKGVGVHNVCVCTAGRWVGCVERMCVCERWGSNVCL